MDLNLIKKLVRIVDSSEITDLEIEESGFRIKIAKKIRGLQGFSQPQIMAHSVPADQSVAAKEEVSKTEVIENTHEIRSPIVGTFYRAPAPDADSYVNVGDIVSPGTVLCIVEAMKLMNEIEADVSGKILKVLVENGKPVEYNQPLFLIQNS
ncbi:MAG: acetyl-CoA carboxylase biotin carboxyl carrier protein [Ignavibacteriales bacterium]|nr:MAG: acetyl-CoA carboxylase biotin carboxyl carrier protein [Ignavibacteriales bacterium]